MVLTGTVIAVAAIVGIGFLLAWAFDEMFAAPWRRIRLDAEERRRWAQGREAKRDQ